MVLFRDTQGNYDLADVVIGRRKSGSYVVNGITTLGNVKYIAGDLSYAECFTIYLQLKGLIKSGENHIITNVVKELDY